MIDIDELAIADVLRHSSLGIVSHQPDGIDRQKCIRVMDIDGKMWIVSIENCFNDASWDEKDHYWETIKEG